MTSAPRRAIAPPRASPRQALTATAGEPPARAPLLTMHTTSRTHADLLTSLVDSTFELRPIARWEHFLREAERLIAGVVLLDLDEAERSQSLRALGISAHRVTHLLARDLQHRAAALVVVTAQDYAEIEDLMRAGVDALLHPGADLDWCAEQVRLAATRRRAIRVSRALTDAPGRDVVAAVAAWPRGTAADGELVMPPVLDEPLATLVPGPS